MTGDPIKECFQSFGSKSHGEKGPERLAELRRLMEEERLDVWLVPHGDEHQNEYPPQYARRLGWLTGFTGSAGYCLVTRDEAIVFVDGRYSAQVIGQIEPDYFTRGDLVKEPPHQWLKKWLDDRTENKQQIRPLHIGFDPQLMTMAAKRRFNSVITPKQVSSQASREVVMVAKHNLVDRIWHDQPHPPLEPISIQAEEFSGKLALDEINKLKRALVQKSADLCLLTDPASIAWLFNIRGGDTDHTPLALGYAIIRAGERPLLFMDKRKMSREVEAYLTQLAQLYAPSHLEEELATLANDANVLADSNKVSTALGDLVTGNNGRLIEAADPVILLRAVKNDSEIRGSRNAHLRDGLAVTRFLYWLDQQKTGTVDEITAVRRLESLRRTTAEKFQSKLMDISFETISGAGANGAIVHYRVTNETNAVLEDNSLYLVDSGGQYEDGTTDITRTVAIGTPPNGAVEDFTLVLKGHIAIALARFPQATRGMDIDALARIALWQHGRDYAHGTGHGIGSYLSVHEGPQSISRRGLAELLPGMIVSNEPGYYRKDHYGIRIENLLLVKQAQEIDGGNTPVMGFETLSMAPIDLRLVNPELMNESELHWLNAYHGWIKRQLSPHLDEAEAKWLEKATTPLSSELPAASA